MAANEDFYGLIGTRAERRGRFKLEPDVHRTWEVARNKYPDVRYRPDQVVLHYFMHYAAAYVHPDEDANVTLSRWLAKPKSPGL